MRIESDLEWVAANERAWECVASNGYSFDSEAEVTNHIEGKLSPIMDEALVSDDLVTISEMGLKLLAELQSEELDLWSTLQERNADKESLSRVKRGIRDRLIEEELDL